MKYYAVTLFASIVLVVIVVKYVFKFVLTLL